GVVLNILTRELREYVLITDERGGFDAVWSAGLRPGVGNISICFVPGRRPALRVNVHFKRYRPVPSRKAAGDGRKPFDERQPAHERDVFTKDDQLLFVINAFEMTFGVEQ